MYCHCQLQAALVALMLQRRSSSSHWLPAMWMILSCVLTFTWSTHQWRLGRCVLRRDQYNLHALSFRLLWQFPWVQWCYWWVLTAYLTQGALLHPLFEVTIQARQPHTLSCKWLHLGNAWMAFMWLINHSAEQFGGTTTLLPLTRQPSSTLKSSLWQFRPLQSLIHCFEQNLFMFKSRACSQTRNHLYTREVLHTHLYVGLSNKHANVIMCTHWLLSSAV